MERASRRRFLALGALATTTAIAGCGDGGDEDGDDGGAGDPGDGGAGDGGTGDGGAGEDGEDGAGDGEDGTDGDDGTDGGDGEDGTDGGDGQDGTDGEDGSDGEDGEDGSDGGDGGDGGGGGEEQLDTFLSDNDAAEYDGSVEDMTGEDEVTVTVGAGSDGVAFDPPAIRVDSGTTIVWEWTGEGGGHNVVPTDDSDFTDFGEEEIIDEEGYTVEGSFDESGVGTYLCEPHQAVGMYGGFVVE